MRKTLVSAVVAALAACTVFAWPASAAAPEDNCHGVASQIASTWPWAHEGQPELFGPPPGGLKLWLTEFGPIQFGVDSIHELQLLFCSGE
jgi:hypothetical protein